MKKIKKLTNSEELKHLMSNSDFDYNTNMIFCQLMTQLMDKKVSELKSLLKKNNFYGYTGFNKSQLVLIVFDRIYKKHLLKLTRPLSCAEFQQKIEMKKIHSMPKTNLRKMYPLEKKSSNSNADIIVKLTPEL